MGNAIRIDGDAVGERTAGVDPDLPGPGFPRHCPFPVTR